MLLRSAANAASRSWVSSLEPSSTKIISYSSADRVWASSDVTRPASSGGELYVATTTLTFTGMHRTVLGAPLDGPLRSEDVPAGPDGRRGGRMPVFRQDG